MIITCNNCNKNFEVDSSLIPENGRLVQCNSCNHKWFFKKTITDKPAPIVKIKDLIEEQELLKEVIVPFEKGVIHTETEIPKTIELLDRITSDVSVVEINPVKDKTEKHEVKEDDKEIEIKKSKDKKNYNILSLTVVFIITFIALIIIFDTFQKPISNIIPNIEFLLYNLYETINDIVLFIRDLI